MNITTREVLRHFLQRGRTPSCYANAGISPFLKTFFTKIELVNIVLSLYADPALSAYDNLEKMTNEELLEAIGDDTLILSYYLDRWDDERESNISIEKESVRETLTQLSMETYYLGAKPVDEWDSYDLNNYRSLQLKAGKICRVYGIYKANIKEEDVDATTSPPTRFYESRELAETAFEEMIITGQFQEHELHILPLYSGR